MNDHQPPTPRTDSGWSWYDFWNWYRVQSLDIQAWTITENELVKVIGAMSEDVQNEVLYYAPVDVQSLFPYGMDDSQRLRLKIRSHIQEIMRNR